MNVIRHGDVNLLCKQVMSVISYELATDYSVCDLEYDWDITREYQLIFVSKSIRRKQFI